jgi:hypothetical protein
VLASTDELDDLQVIAIAEAGLGPLLARDDVAIQFYRHAIGFHTQLFEQSGEREWCGKIARLTVDLKLHLTRIVAGREVRRQAAG